MKHISAIALPFALLINPAYADKHLKQYANESKAVVQEFIQQLKGELQSSMKSGGPIVAIDMCKYKAPDIAKELSDKYGWKIARTSLKTRNPANAPDAWEKNVLEKFESRKSSGESIKPMAYFSEVEIKGEKSFRFMKAIPVAKPCLACHGENINVNVLAKLNEQYPDDKATGYKLGDVRGAFTIVRPIK